MPGYSRSNTTTVVQPQSGPRPTSRQGTMFAEPRKDRELNGRATPVSAMPVSVGRDGTTLMSYEDAPKNQREMSMVGELPSKNQLKTKNTDWETDSVCTVLTTRAVTVHGMVDDQGSHSTMCPAE